MKTAGRWFALPQWKVESLSRSSVSFQELHQFIHANVIPGSKIYTDEARGYNGVLCYKRESINHGVGEYVRG